jgi:disulfide bond formation protein DsbB
MSDLLLKIISLGSISIFVLLLFCVMIDFFDIKHPFKKIIKTYQLELLFFISLFSVVGSLMLSIYFKLPACELCWYQRIFLFCTPIITALAIYRRDMYVRIYVLVLSVIGFIIALYHALLQSGLFKRDSVFCNPNSLIDCSIPSFTYFGFVTVPIISCSIFLILIYISSYASDKK